MSGMNSEELRAVLAAYYEVASVSWPELHPAMAANRLRWTGKSASQLEAELEGYIQEAAPPRSNVRVFWKLGPEYRFAGCNELFAKDAGLRRAELIGLNDYDKRLPWFPNAAKFRSDDEEIFKSGRANLDILEHQKAATGTTWVRAGKTPIQDAAGKPIGIFGMYEVLDGATGRKLFSQREGIR
jgi:PAS fold